jgi:preprotein translocase subunit SecE
MAKNSENVAVEQEVSKPAKAPAKKKKDAKAKQKKPNWFKSLGSELKKVTWPTFGKVIKQTGIVIGVTVFFMVVVGLIDFGLTQLYQLLI